MNERMVQELAEALKNESYSVTILNCEYDLFIGGKKEPTLEMDEVDLLRSKDWLISKEIQLATNTFCGPNVKTHSICILEWEGSKTMSHKIRFNKDSKFIINK